MNLFPPKITQRRQRQGQTTRQPRGSNENRLSSVSETSTRPSTSYLATPRTAARCYLARIRPNLRITERRRTDLTVKQQAFDSLLYGRPLHARRGFFTPECGREASILSPLERQNRRCKRQRTVSPCHFANVAWQWKRSLETFVLTLIFSAQPPPLPYDRHLVRPMRMPVG